MNIVVLAGGLSPERDVSFKTGENVVASLRSSGHNAFMIDVFMGYGDSDTNIRELFRNPDAITMQNLSIKDEAPDLKAIKKMREDKSDMYFGPNVIRICTQADLVFLALHGSDGENGKIQAALDLMGIKYTGNDFLSCAMAMNKGIAKKYLSSYDIPFPKGFSVLASERSTKAENTLFPCVVKPANGGSSIGMSIVKEASEYEAALDKAFAWEKEVLVEEFIEGREFTVGVIDGQALPVIEIIPNVGEFDYKNKYTAGATAEICPAELDESIAEEMQLYAERVCTVLGLNVYARMDFMLDKNNKLYCLEANTLPGLTSTSLIPKAAASVGLSYENLIDEIIRVSLNRYV